MTQDADRDLSRLYRAGAAEEPPPELDRRIARAARGGMRGAAWRKFFDAMPRWRLAVGGLAVAVLSVSVVTIMHEESPSTVIPSSSVDPPAGSRANDHAARRDLAQRSDPAARSHAEERAGASSLDAPVEPRQQQEVRPARSALPKHEEAALAPAAPKQESADVSKAAEGGASPAPSAAARVAAASADAAPGAVAATPMPTPPRAEESAARSELEPTTRARAARKEREQAAARSSPVPEEHPEAWAKRLVELLRQGREAEARAGLARLRERYPAFALPEELRRLGAASSSPVPAHGVGESSPIDDGALASKPPR